MCGKAQSTQNNKYAIPLQYLKNIVSDEVDFLQADKHQSFLQVDTTIFFVCLISRKKLGMKLIFCIQVNIKVFHKFIL